MKTEGEKGDKVRRVQCIGDNSYTNCSNTVFFFNGKKYSKNSIVLYTSVYCFKEYTLNAFSDSLLRVLA